MDASAMSSLDVSDLSVPCCSIHRFTNSIATSGGSRTAAACVWGSKSQQRHQPLHNKSNFYRFSGTYR